MGSRSVLLPLAAGVAALALVAAGCGGGGGGSPQVANNAATGTATTTASATPQSALVAFSGCMRSHGMPSFPDPQRLSGQNFKLTIHQAVGDNPRYEAAMGSCSHLLPNRGGTPDSAQQIRTQIADGLSFARCMRGHGLNRFPDPTAQGQLTVAMVQAQGIDVHSPAVLRIVQACLPASHGALTPAKIREALNNNPGG